MNILCAFIISPSELFELSRKVHSRHWLAACSFVSAGCRGLLSLSSRQSFSLLPIGSPLHAHTWRGRSQKEVKTSWPYRSLWEFTLEHSNRCWAVEPGLSGFCGNIQHLGLPRVRTQPLFVLNSHLFLKKKNVFQTFIWFLLAAPVQITWWSTTACRRSPCFENSV